MTNKGPWQLEVQDEPGRSVELPQKGMLVLGSSDDRAGLVLTGPGVDGAHCAIGQVKDGGWAIKDLGSQRGTFVNGERISSTRLAAGDVVAVGGSSLRVIDPAAPPADTLAETKVGPRETADAPRESGDAPGKPALERLGGFRIERRLGRGGMGEVLLAVQESLSRPVALKVLAAKFASDADFVRRFHSEARAAAALSHPNVVVVHDVGEADGRHFLAMEYMPGGNLEERVAREGRLAWREVLDVLHDAAAGLTYAEAQGILHRDIKPANLMVAASGSVKIADLGLATPVDEQDADQKTFGTPHFISPEQARGEAVDHRSDLYSLGATAYRLLTGHTPFGGSTAAEIVRARFSEDPSPLRHQVPTIPPELEDLVLRLMEREAENRFPSADALLREVDRIRLQADHGTEPAVAPGASSRLPLLLGGVAVLVAAIAGWALLGGTADDPLADDGRRDPGGTVAASGTDSPGTGASDPEIDEGTFFGDPGGEDTTESDDLDQRLRALELEAKGAYSEIPADYSTEDRIGALEDLIERYGPTSVAATARSEIERLRAGETAAQIAAESRSRDVAESVRRLGTAAGWPPRALGPDDPVPAPWQIVSSIQGYQVSTAMISDPEFLAQRGALIDEVLRAAADRATRALASADALAEQGSFDEIAGVLAPFEKELALPDPELGEPSGYAALRTLALELTARLAGLERERALHVARVATRDRVELARALGPSTTSTVELRALQLDAPIARLTAIAATLATPDARVVAEQAGGRLTRARDALLLLVASHDARQWRRDTVGVPSGRRSTPRETLGARPGGLLVGGDGGQELVPWETFATDPESLLRLFRGRLSRDYTAPEEAAILSLLTVNAVQHALAPALASLGAEGAGGRSLFRPQDTETMQRAFDAAVDWASSAESSLGPARLELEREREAAGILADALAASEESAWTRAVARLETLFGDYGDTLLVLQLSDGSLPVEPDLPAEPEVVAAPDNGDANGDASDGPGESEDG